MMQSENSAYSGTETITSGQMRGLSSGVVANDEYLDRVRRDIISEYGGVEEFKKRYDDMATILSEAMVALIPSIKQTLYLFLKSMNDFSSALKDIRRYNRNYRITHGKHGRKRPR